MVLRDLTSATCTSGASSSARAPLSSLAARLAEQAGAPSHAPQPQLPTSDDRINDLIHGRYPVPHPQNAAPPAQQPSPMHYALRDSMLVRSHYTPVMPPLPEPAPDSITARFEAAYASATTDAVPTPNMVPAPSPPMFHVPHPTPAFGPIPYRGIPRVFPQPIVRLPLPNLTGNAVGSSSTAAAGSSRTATRDESGNGNHMSISDPNTNREAPNSADVDSNNEALFELMRRLQHVGIRTPNMETMQTMTDSQASLGEEFNGLDEFQGTAGAEVEDDENRSTLDSYANDLIVAGLMNRQTQQEYRFEETNSFYGSAATDALAEGERLRAEGQLTRALLAFEAALNRPAIDPHPPLEPVDVLRAWYLLGITLAECDDDERAIQALNRVTSTRELDAENIISERSDEHQPLNIAAAAALALAVSYVNEMNIEGATTELWRWLRYRAMGIGGSSAIPVPTRNNDDMAAIIRALNNLASADNLEDMGEVQLALGIAYNAIRDYDSAATALRRALAGRDDDARLWNRLGATLANGGRTDDALRAYRRAVDLCPLYVRAWVNVGTAYANNHDFGRAARYYLRALDMASEAEEMAHVWEYLRTTLFTLEKDELVKYIDEKNLDAMREHFSF